MKTKLNFKFLATHNFNVGHKQIRSKNVCCTWALFAFVNEIFTRRFFPDSQQLRSFNLCPTLASPGDDDTVQKNRGGQVEGGADSLSSLPYEVLCHMASFLDSFSLSQLALVSRFMRQVCSSLLQERGMVTLRWERKTYSHGGAKWRAKPVKHHNYPSF